MLQNQYYNNKLNKNHIEQILTNYNIKYNTMKNEIDSKFNRMIKLFLTDIRAFLENIEDIMNERRKIKEAENFKMEISILKTKLEEKSKNENKMKNEIDLLTRENTSLKMKIKTQNNIPITRNEDETRGTYTNLFKNKTKTGNNNKKYLKYTISGY